MITFLLCLGLLVAAYFTYGRYLERLVGVDHRAETPCQRLYDGVDYVPLPRWRIFLIQLLNIAGLGPSSEPYSAQPTGPWHSCGSPWAGSSWARCTILLPE